MRKSLEGIFCNEDSDSIEKSRQAGLQNWSDHGRIAGANFAASKLLVLIFSFVLFAAILLVEKNSLLTGFCQLLSNHSIKIPVSSKLELARYLVQDQKASLAVLLYDDIMSNSGAAMDSKGKRDILFSIAEARFALQQNARARGALIRALAENAVLKRDKDNVAFLMQVSKLLREKVSYDQQSRPEFLDLSGRLLIQLAENPNCVDSTVSKAMQQLLHECFQFRSSQAKRPFPSSVIDGLLATLRRMNVNLGPVEQNTLMDITDWQNPENPNVNELIALEIRNKIGDENRLIFKEHQFCMANKDHHLRKQSLIRL